MESDVIVKSEKEWTKEYKDALELLNPVLGVPKTRKIARIKEIRASTGLNLKDAKDLCDEIQDSIPDMADLDLTAQLHRDVEHYSHRCQTMRNENVTLLSQRSIDEEQVKDLQYSLREALLEADNKYDGILKVKFYLAAMRGMTDNLTDVEQAAFSCILALAESAIASID